jgi:hypothetical protein
MSRFALSCLVGGALSCIGFMAYLFAAYDEGVWKLVGGHGPLWIALVPGLIPWSIHGALVGAIYGLLAEFVGPATRRGLIDKYLH